MNKSNSTAGSVRVEADLLGTSTIIARFLLQMHYKKMSYLKNEGKNVEAQHLQLRHSMANIKIYKRRSFSLAIAISEILAFQICYHESVCQDRVVQRSQQCYSTANINCGHFQGSIKPVLNLYQLGFRVVTHELVTVLHFI